MVMNWPSRNQFACLRSRPTDIPPCGRQWHRMPRGDLTFRRRSEIYDLAFTLLGGRVAARDFLLGPVPDHACTVLEIATGSSIGQAQITSMLWKIAARRVRRYQ